MSNWTAGAGTPRSPDESPGRRWCPAAILSHPRPLHRASGAGCRLLESAQLCTAVNLLRPERPSSDASPPSLPPSIAAVRDVVRDSAVTRQCRCHGNVRYRSVLNAWSMAAAALSARVCKKPFATIHVTLLAPGHGQYMPPPTCGETHPIGGVGKKARKERVGGRWIHTNPVSFTEAIAGNSCAADETGGPVQFC